MKRQIETQGRWVRPSAYDDGGYPITRTLIEDGRRNLVLGGLVETGCPVHILQGMADPDVPHAHALRLSSLLPSDDLTVSLIPDGDHRLSRPQDLDMIVRAVAAMADHDR